MDNKRKDERVGKQTRAEVHTKDGMTFSSSIDLSSGGIFISTPEPLKEGEKIELVINCSATESVEVSGTIRWNRDEDGETRAGMGIQFSEMSNDDQKKIEKLLA